MYRGLGMESGEPPAREDCASCKALLKNDGRPMSLAHRDLVLVNTVVSGPQTLYRCIICKRLLVAEIKGGVRLWR